MPKKLTIGDIVYHSIHGLCRVDGIFKENGLGRAAAYYSLVPKISSRMRQRFVVATDALDQSGFHTPLSSREAKKILDYFRAGLVKAREEQDALRNSRTFAEENQPWALAEAILAFSNGKMEGRDQKRRQLLERAAKGLVGELAYALGVSPRQAASEVRRRLRDVATINPHVITALQNAARS